MWIDDYKITLACGGKIEPYQPRHPIAVDRGALHPALPFHDHRYRKACGAAMRRQTLVRKSWA